MKKASIDTIKQLREKTGAGVMDVKRALEECKGDEKQAVEWIMKKGLAKAEKRADKETTEGFIGSYVHQGGRIAALVMLACETDFVAKTPDFQTLARELAMQITSMEPKNVKGLLKQDYIRDNSKTVEQLIGEVVAKIGEKIEVKEFTRLDLGKTSKE